MTLAGLDSLLEAGALELGVPLNPSQRSALLKLLAELADWNTRFNLTAIRDPQEVVRKHLLDSLSVQAHLHGQTIADVGSGAGFPGLPLAIVNPERQFTLIEATAKKVGFIQHIIDTLNLTNVTAVNARAEAWRPEQPYDSVISRALGKIPQFVRLTEHFCAPKGRLLAMKGQYPHDELKGLPKKWRVVAVRKLQVPGLDAERHLVELSSAT